MHMKKLLRVLLVLFIAAGLMPMQVMAEETGETAETFEKPYDYSITVVYHACGGKFGTSWMRTAHRNWKRGLPVSHRR